MNNHLTDQEISTVATSGPAKLMEHDEANRGHMHLVHEGCGECWARLLVAITLLSAPVGEGAPQ